MWSETFHVSTRGHVFAIQTMLSLSIAFLPPAIRICLTSPSQTITTPTPAASIRIIVSRHRDDNIYQHAQRAFEVVRLSVAQEVAYDEDGKDEEDGLEHREVEILVVHVSLERWLKPER